VFAVGRGDFALVDRGLPDEHSARNTNDTPACAYDRRYEPRTLGPASQTSHLRACKRFAAWLRRSPDTATPVDVKHFQLHLMEIGTSICTQNQTMARVKFLLRVTLRRPDLVAEIFSLSEPVRIPLVLSKKEIKRILVMAPSLKARVMLSLAYGCGMRASEVVRLKVGDIVPEARLRHDDSAQEIIWNVQAKGRKRNVMLPSDILVQLRA
jgi:integrase/recombinase XerD